MTSDQVGVFSDAVGLSYRSKNLKGTTGQDGQFHFVAGQDIVFYIGSLELGRAKGKPRLSVLDLVDEASLTNPKLLNRARLLWSVAPGLGLEKPSLITDNARQVISKYAPQINLNASDPAELDTVLHKIGAELGLLIKSISHIRNHLRRALAGFKVLRDIRIPVRDDNYVLGDIYLPAEGRHPALVSSTVYGKRVVFSGPRLDDPDEISAFEQAEDTWFSTSDRAPIPIPNTGGYFGNWTKQRDYETISTLNTFFWVPRGYAMVKIDPRGVGQTPGERGVLVSKQEANDICDVIEWASNEPWCSGNVALTGNSYGANCQWPAVMQRPAGLKAFVPYGTEIDLYRDLAYVGGIPTFDFLSIWTTGIRASSPLWRDAEDIVEKFSKHPFYDNFWKSIEINLESIDVPVFLGAAQMLTFHNRGPYEAWRRLSSKDKHLEVVDTNYYSWPNREAVEKLFLFLERHLKGVDHQGSLEPVGVQMRVGHGDWYWRTELDWPLPGTEYVDWHLHTNGSMDLEAPATDERVEAFPYSADIKPKSGKAGVSFVSKPFETDVELAGHFTAILNISSTSYDADVVVSVWALDEEGKAVRFCVDSKQDPLTSGLLRASHRRTDPEKSLPWKPWHTHREEDYAPLKGGETVEVSVEMSPATARIRTGWRLRVDILPTETQPDIAGFQPVTPRSWIKDYHDGAINKLHLGGQFKNFIRVPVVPLRDVGLLNVVV